MLTLLQVHVSDDKGVRQRRQNHVSLLEARWLRFAALKYPFSVAFAGD